MGYHIAKIEKGVYGTIDKVKEEVEEFIDARNQSCLIMMHVELSDIYGALEALSKNYGLSMEDLKSMSDITKRAFTDGSRKND